MIQQAKFTYSPLDKAFERQIITVEYHGRRQIDAIMNQSKRLTTLNNKDDHKDNYKKILEKLAKERFDEIK